jgi:hypothetical protein
VDLDAAAIDEQSIGCAIGACKRAEDALPDAALGPAHEAIVERLLRPIHVRAVRPAPAAAQGVNDPAQHPAIVDTRLAAHISWQQRRDPLPLRIRKPEEISHFTASSPRQ